jgi:hypothetical protein
MIRIFGRLAAATAMLCAAAAHAETSANDTLAALKGPNADIPTIYVNGVLNGIGQANAMIIISGGRPLYCQPDNLALTSGQAANIMQNFVLKNPRTGADPFSVVMILALEDVFPCAKQ